MSDLHCHGSYTTDVTWSYPFTAERSMLQDESTKTYNILVRYPGVSEGSGVPHGIETVAILN